MLAPIEAGLAGSKFVVAAREMLASLVVIEIGRELAMEELAASADLADSTAADLAVPIVAVVAADLVAPIVADLAGSTAAVVAAGRVDPIVAEPADSRKWENLQGQTMRWRRLQRRAHVLSYHC